MKYVPLIAATGLAIVLCIQNGIIAGGNPPPRSVPIIVQDVMTPSKMVAVSFAEVSTTPVQAPIDLLVDQVFILTSATVTSSNHPRVLMIIKNGSITVDKLEVMGAPSGSTDSHHCYPTGIRFPRAANGQADLFLQNYFSDVTDVALHGYITDDF